MMTLGELLEQLPHLSGFGNSFKPHKHLALLAVIQLVNSGSIRSHDVFFNDEATLIGIDLTILSSTSEVNHFGN
jgi:hypothetical protein